MESLKITNIFELGPLADNSFTGGIENHIISLLSEFSAMGHECKLITGSIPDTKKYSKLKLNGLDNVLNNEKSCLNKDLEIEILRKDFLGLIKRSWNPYNLQFSRQLLFCIKNTLEGILPPRTKDLGDIINGHIYTSGLSAYILGKMSRIPSLNTIHGSYFDYWPLITDKKSITATFFRPLERILAPFLANRVAKQIHTDYYFANKVKSWGVPAHKIVSIHNGANPENFSPNVEPDPKYISEFSIVTTRRLVRKNGVHILISAMNEVLRNHSQIKLFIVGDGPEKSNLIKQTKKLKIDKNIIFTGRIPNCNIPKVLAAANVVVVPSLIEASSISVIEAMLMNKPIIVTKIPGIVEITKPDFVTQIKSNDAQQMANGILNVFNNPAVALNKAKTAYLYAKNNLTIRKSAEIHLKLYKDILTKQ